MSSICSESKIHVWVFKIPFKRVSPDTNRTRRSNLSLQLISRFENAHGKRLDDFQLRVQTSIRLNKKTPRSISGLPLAYCFCHKYPLGMIFGSQDREVGISFEQLWWPAFLYLHLWIFGLFESGSLLLLPGKELIDESCGLA